MMGKNMTVEEINEVEMKFRAPTKIDQSTHELMYFELIRPIDQQEAAEIMGLDITDKQGDYYEENVERVREACELVSRLSSSSYIDPEYNQIVDTNRRPHKKWKSEYFLNRLSSGDRKQCLKSILMSSLGGSSCPTFRVFYAIKKKEYEKKMESVKEKRREKAERARYYYEEMAKTVPDIASTVDHDALLRLRMQAVRTTDEYKRQDPDVPESVFEDKEQAEAVRSIRSRLKGSARG